MSNTRPYIGVNRLLASVPHSMLRLARFVAAGAIVLALAMPALATAYTWDAGGSGTNLFWLNGTNWSPDAGSGLPGASDNVTFAGSATGTPTAPAYNGGTSGGTVTNEVNFNKTINSLTYSQVDGGTTSSRIPVYHVTKIDPGVTLKISGTTSVSDTAAYGTPGAYSFSAGVDLGSTNNFNLTTTTLFTGGGSLDISDALGHSTGGDIVIRQTTSGVSGSNGTQTAEVDLSGLTSFNANVDQLLIGYSAAPNGGTGPYQRATGTLYLAQNNAITMNSTLSSGSVGLAIGYDPGNGNMKSDTISMYSTLYLGQTNNIAVNNVWIGAAKSGGALAFNTAKFSNSTLYMRGVNPTGGSNALIPAGTITVADGSNSGSSPSAGVMDLTGGTVDILTTQLIVGRDQTAVNANNRHVTGSLSFDSGSIVVGPTSGSPLPAAMIIGQHSAAGGAPICAGTVTVGSNAHLTVNGEMQMASFAAGSVGSATAILNINGGTVTLGGNIDKGVTASGTTTAFSSATININGGTLDMGGGGTPHDIGYYNGTPSSAVPIDNFTMHGGSLTNVRNLTVTNFTAAGDVYMPTGDLTIGSAGKIDLRDGTAQTITAHNLTLLGNSSLNFELSNNVSSGNDKIVLSNQFSLASGSNLSLVIARLNSSFASGTYTLMTYASKSATAPTFVNTTRSPMTMHLNDTSLTLDVTNRDGIGLTWNGTGSTWDVIQAGHTYWNTGTGTDIYYDGDSVTFPTLGSGAAVISVSNFTGFGMAPNAVTVSSDTDYTFNAAASTDRISGLTGLTKSGTGTLFMNLANDYMGTTDLLQGKIVLQNATALGSASAPLVIGRTGLAATLDLNMQQLYAKPITVQGSGVGGLGAIVNNSASTPAGTQYDVSNVTLSGDTTIGGTAPTASNPGLPNNQYIGRWAFRAQTGSATLSTGGHAYNLTKTGNNQIMLVNTNTDAALANVTVNEGVLSLEGTTTLGNPSNTITVNGTGAGQPAGGAILQLRGLTVALNKNVVLQNNGQLYAMLNGSDSDNTVNGSVAIDVGGGVVNTGGLRADYTSNTPNSGAKITINGALTGSTPFTKTGPGVLTLNSSASTFNGSTTVNDGTLIVNGILLGNMTITPSQTVISSQNIVTTLAGTGTLGAGGGTVTVGGTLSDVSGGAISPGPDGTSGSVGTLTLNNLTFNSPSPTYGGTINFDLAPTPSGSNDLLSLTGNLSLSASARTTIAINEVGGQGSIVGTYRLINYSGSETGSAAANLTLAGVAVNSRRTYTLNDATPHQINLVVGGTPANLTWVGDGTSNSWNVANATNTVWSSSVPPNIFYNLDAVAFTDNGNNALDIKVDDRAGGYVQPGSITINDSLKNYTFSGMGKITGAAGLAKSGTGTVILKNGSAGNVNDFSGPITINGGVLQIGDGATAYTSIGTGPIANNAQLVFNQTGSNTVAGIISGSGSVEQRGSSSTLTLSAANLYDGVTLITGGILQAGNDSALGSTVGGTTISNGATLDINNFNLGSEAITVQGAGVSNYGAIVNNNTATSTTAQQALRFVTMAGDTTFGGVSNAGAANSGRWDIRGTTSAQSSLSTNGHAYNLTKVGNNQVSLVATTVDPALGDVTVNQGVLELELTTTLGDPTHTVTVDGGAGTPGTMDSATLQFYNLATPLNKNVVLQNGGSLYAKSNSLATDNTISGNVYIADTSGLLNTGGTRSDITTAVTGTTMTLNGALQNVSGGSSAAAVYKLGPGTVILANATNSFNGTVNLNDGTLVVNGSLAGSITMASSPTGVRTTLSGTGAIAGPVQDASGTSIAPGASAANGATGTLSLGNSLTLGGNGQGQVNMDLSSNPAGAAGTNDLIDLTSSANGNLWLLGTTTVQINPVNGFLGIGTYHLIHYAGSLTGTADTDLMLAGTPVDTRQGYTLSSATAHYINLVVGGTAPQGLTWVGGSGGSNAWDVHTTTNWSGASDHLFYNADQVTFDDSSANNTVNLASAVLPGSVTFNNSTHDYTITGAGYISGGAAFTKSGTGAVTLATSNDYSGQTTVQNGTLYVTGAIGDNSAISITGGTLKAGSNIALGTNNSVGTTINGGTLDINAMDLQTEPVTVQGAGVGSNGAIINNSSTAQPNALTQVSLAGNATFGGSGNWSMQTYSGGPAASLSTGGNAYNLTKTGAGTIDLIAVSVDSALGNFIVNQGILKFEDATTFGSSAGSATIASAGTLQFLKATNAFAKTIISNGGTISASSSNTTAQDIISGAVTINSTTTVNADNAAGSLTFTNIMSGTGGLTKTGSGTVFITGTPSYNGDTAVNAGVLQIDTVGSATLHNVTGAGTLGVGDGTNATDLTATSINIGTLTLGAGSTLSIAAIPGGPSAHARLITPVPEPATWAMLVLAALALGIYRRRSR